MNPTTLSTPELLRVERDGAEVYVTASDGLERLCTMSRAGESQRLKDARMIVESCNSHAAVLEALKKVCENSRLMLAKAGAAGHRQTTSGEWVCDPWLEAFNQARAAIAQAEKGAA